MPPISHCCIDAQDPAERPRIPARNRGEVVQEMLETEMTKHVGGTTATSVVRDARVTATATRILDTSSYHYHPSKRTSSVPSG